MPALPIDSSFVAKAMPPKMKDAHKRMNGTVCVVGGSRLYHGAPFLCGMGAMRSGVDLVYIAVPKALAPSIRALSPDFIVVPLPDQKLTRGNVSKLLSWVRGVDAYAVGPGLGAQNPEEVAHCLSELKGEGKGLVVDADALLPRSLEMIRKSKTVVTPHAGEFERLFGVKLPADLEGRVSAVSEQAKTNGIVVLLKGPTDVISDGERVGLNSTHSPAMTVGGTGDVLTGVTAGLVARGVDLFDAACAAAFVNGEAGAEAAREFGLHITASDVANRIANAMKKYDRLV
ncbi:MAG TPA: NAD(P)H-hydrate dehydratase [Nitrososphaerales archaeon]|nr:NAD(P)H-hydrate dehydratase [Nitrososphaerales archaeon]